MAAGGIVSVLSFATGFDAPLLGRERAKGGDEVRSSPSSSLGRRSGYGCWGGIIPASLLVDGLSLPGGRGRGHGDEDEDDQFADYCL